MIIPVEILMPYHNANNIMTVNIFPAWLYSSNAQLKAISRGTLHTTKATHADRSSHGAFALQ